MNNSSHNDFIILGALSVYSWTSSVENTRKEKSEHKAVLSIFLESHTHTHGVLNLLSAYDVISSSHLVLS